MDTPSPSAGRASGGCLVLNPVIDIRSRSLHVYFVRCLGSLAAAVDQAAPQHDLSCRMQHRVNLLARQVQKVTTFLEREQARAHFQELPCKSVQT